MEYELESTVYNLVEKEKRLVFIDKGVRYEQEEIQLTSLGLMVEGKYN